VKGRHDVESTPVSQPSFVAPGTEPPDPEAEAVREAIAQLGAILIEEDFANRMVQNIAEPTAPMQRAFRSPELARRSYTAARFMIKKFNKQIAQRELTLSSSREPFEEYKRWRRNVERLRDAVGLEQRHLEEIIRGMNASEGVLSTSPNPRQRALERLAEENRRGPLKRGRITQLLHEETEALEAAIAAQREKKKEASRKERRQAGLPAPPPRNRPTPRPGPSSGAKGSNARR
jgi:hypothetical protein